MSEAQGPTAPDDDPTVVVAASAFVTDDDPTTVVGPAVDDDEQTVIVAPAPEDADDDPTVMVASSAVVGEDDPTVIVAPGERAADGGAGVAAEPGTDRVAAVGAGVAAEPHRGSALSSTAPGPALGATAREAYAELDEHSIRRALRPRRPDREPLRPLAVPPGRHGPVLPGAGPGAVFSSEVRALDPVAVPAAPAAPVPAERALVRSVAATSRRGAIAALVITSTSVLVSIVGLAWVVRALVLG